MADQVKIAVQAGTALQAEMPVQAETALQAEMPVQAGTALQVEMPVQAENRIDLKFKNLKELGKKAFIAFITAGDPSLAKTEEFALVLEESGVDILELGIPFSDPVAEGPVIQAASERALNAGTKIDSVFETVKKIRAKSEMPILFMMYANCIYVYGKERFFANCAKTGVDGVIVPDLPLEEQWEIKDLAQSNGVHNILLAAPTSDERIEKIASQANGFLYCVSSSGVTGTRSSFSTDFEKFSSEIKKHCAVPAAVGFGVSSPEQARELGKYFDGVIIGSAFVKIIEKYADNSARYLKEFAEGIRKVL
ncbi:MAG: tryptophan synthase subunit alpha [Clostridiales bacterium]|nr:tryptophan synthase subunit alpha [Clostridiales bacterium]